MLSQSLFQIQMKLCCPSPTIVVCFWVRRSTALRRKSRCDSFRAAPLTNPRGSKLLASRLRAAIARRKPLLDAANNACRLCFSEADELPGLIADKYNDLIILQFLTKGLLTAGVRDTCIRVLREELSPAAILERPDPRVRELESLPAISLDPLWLR
jgi:23S rRNA G2069 N7-methylase RlmK/C1962 C5-methylase RlmI